MSRSRDDNYFFKKTESKKSEELLAREKQAARPGVLGDLDSYLATTNANRTTLRQGLIEYTATSNFRTNHYSFMLEHDLTLLGEINPTHIDSESESAWQAIMHVDNIGKCFPAGSNFMSITDDDGVSHHYHFTTPYALGVREDQYFNIIVYAVDTDERKALDRGVTGAVYPVMGAVKYRIDDRPGLKFEEDGEKSAVKIGSATNHSDSYKKTVREEYEIAKHTSHLRPREPLFGVSRDKQTISWLQMRKLRGKSLLEILNDDVMSSIDPDRRALTLQDRLQLSIALYQQLITQIHAKGLVHSDIKPENILAYHDEHGWHVNIVDVGFARLTSNQTAKSGGTAAYQDKDAMNMQSSVQGDTFAMSLVVGMIWRDRSQLKLLRETRNMSETFVPEFIQALRSKHHWKINFDLFDGLENVLDEDKQSVIRILKEGTHEDKKMRATASDCLRRFEELDFSWRKKMSVIPAAEHAAADKGFTVAQDARQRLLNPIYTNGYLAEETRDDLKREMAAIIDTLPDHSERALHEFTHTLGVIALRGIHDKKDLNDKITHIFDKYFHRYDKIKNIYSELYEMSCQLEQIPHQDVKAHEKNLNELYRYLNQLNQFCEKMIEKTPATIDVVVKQTERLHEKYLKVKTAKNHFVRVLKEAQSPKHVSQQHSKK